MKEILRYGFTLAFICMVASASLAAANSLTKSRIAGQLQAEEEASLSKVLADADHFEAVSSENELMYYKGYNKEGQVMGVAFKARGRGYGGDIETIAGMDLQGNILAIEVLSQNETPGLGSQVAEPDFTGMFSHLSVEKLGEVQAITGATISSRAVIDSVREKAREVQLEMEGYLKDRNLI